MLVARELDLPPVPLELGRRVAKRPGAVLLWSATGGESFVASDPVERRSGLDPEPELSIRPSRTEHDSAPRWVGLLPYECRRSLERPPSGRPEWRAAPHIVEPAWWRYDAVARITDRVLVVGDSRSAVDALAERLSQPAASEPTRLGSPEPTDGAAEHIRRIERALELIGRGEIYQVNLARRFSVHVEGSPIELLARLGSTAPTPYGLALDAEGTTVVSTSPELFLELGGDRSLKTIPIKGTRPRGADQTEDARRFAELAADPKEQAELAMILDVERNDLGRIAETGSVRLASRPAVTTWRTVHHRAAVLTARLKNGLQRSDILEEMLPSGSVTGAPKIRAMEVIAELEPDRRGLYTGALGVLRQSGGLTLSMAIRTLTAQRGVGHYYAGGGIVADSDPVREVEETRWKSVQVDGERPQPRTERAQPPSKLGLGLA